MATKSQDILVALKLSLSDTIASYATLGKDLGMSASEVHSAVRRLLEARLLSPDTKRLRAEPFLKFLVHGVPYAFPATLGELTRGIPTAWAAPIIAKHINSSDQLPPIWPDPEGKVRGMAVEPLYPSAPKAALRDPALYDLLSLVDALRIGRARERTIAEQELGSKLSQHVLT